MYDSVHISNDKLDKTWVKLLQNVKWKSWSMKVVIFLLSFWNLFGLTGEDGIQAEKNEAYKVTQF